MLQNRKTDFVFASLDDFNAKITSIKYLGTYTCYCQPDFTNVITKGRSSITSRGIFSKNTGSTTDFWIITMGDSPRIYCARINTSNGEVTYNSYFSDDATVLGQTINASDMFSDIISDISEADDINETCIRHVQGALLEGKSIYGFVITAKAGSVLSQIIFGSFAGVSGMAVRGKSGNPIQWKDWKIL